VRHTAFLVAGSLESRTGGSIYNRRMIEALRQRGWSVDVHELGPDFPAPAPETLAHAAATLAAIDDDTVVVVDGLAFGAMPDVVAAERTRLRLVPVVHMPLGDEAGLDAATAEARSASEKRALGAATFVVVTGSTTIGAVSAAGVVADRIVLVTPGTDRAPVARGSGGADLRLLCVAALTPGKGHDDLLRALAASRHLGWRLTCVGSETRCPRTAEGVRALVNELRLDDRVEFTGELEDAALARQYDGADLFVLATLRETFGMAVAEAIARAVPVVATRTGEIERIVGEGGCLPPVGNRFAFATALATVLADAAFRAELRGGALAARDRLADWDAAAVTMTAVLERGIDRLCRGDRE
jgi:glycosyltransferase involved in cell wall biosynthesis